MINMKVPSYLHMYTQVTDKDYNQYSGKEKLLTTEVSSHLFFVFCFVFVIFMFPKFKKELN